MSLIKKLTPNNLQSEKQKFLKDTAYNPQFRYDEEIDQSLLNEYGLPKDPYLSLAQEILDRSFTDQTESDILDQLGEPLTQEEVTRKIKTFLSMHNLEKRFHIVWSSSFVSRTSINADTIKLRLPVKFRQQSLLGMLYHEIGTHALRRVNYEQQPWYKRKKKFGFANYLRTEEGLAVLHSLLPQNFQLAYKQARLYLTAHWAQEHSFADVWKRLEPYVSDPETRWTMILKVKRGLADTSQPGGYTKGIAYFEGMVRVWQWLQSHDYSVSDLYYGKLAMEDVEKAKELNPKFQPILPSFFAINPEKYAENLEKVGRVNQFDQVR